MQHVALLMKIELLFLLLKRAYYLRTFSLLWSRFEIRRQLHTRDGVDIGTLPIL
jgi:hypothetical protein